MGTGANGEITLFRRNSPFGHWRLYAPGRARRPYEYAKPTLALQDNIESCPFEPGKEDKTPKELLCYRRDGQCYLRVVANKYPFLRIEGRPFKSDGQLDIRECGPGQELDGTGAHEVVIESPKHNAQFHEFSVFEVSETLAAICERYHDLKRDRRMNYFFAFRNTGVLAGASLIHPHWQIMASVIIPEGAAEILNEYRRYYEAKGNACLYCDQLRKVLECREGENSLFISENQSVVAFAPFAAERLYEVWIVPKENFCNCSFAYPLRDNPAMRNDTAEMLLTVTRRLALFFSNAPELLNYNIAIHTAPYWDDHKGGIFHWHIRIIPRGFTTDGSVEVATKLPIIPGLPEKWAGDLRNIDSDQTSR